MALLLKNIAKAYQYFVIDKADDRTNHWFLVESPVPMLTIIACYLYFVLHIGPKFMQHRKPYKIEKLLIVYNIFQVVACTIIVKRLYPHVAKANFFCEEVNYGSDEVGMSVPYTTYIIFWLKIIDLLDTVFFILRKKYSQVTFLHVYHHAIMVVYMWLCVKYVAGGQLIYLGIMNHFVHSVMYSYYLLTIYDQEYKTSVWWKKHITQMQLIQFFMGTVFLVVPLFQKSCGFPTAVSMFVLPNLFVITALFGDFYYKNYIKAKKNSGLKEEKLMKAK